MAVVIDGSNTPTARRTNPHGLPTVKLFAMCHRKLGFRRTSPGRKNHEGQDYEAHLFVTVFPT